jgi:hypothetical protein
MSTTTRELIFARDYLRETMLTEKTTQAHKNGNPFFWVLGQRSLTPTQVLAVSQAQMPESWGNYRFAHFLNGYCITHPGGMKALAGDLLGKGSVTEIVGYIASMLCRDNQTWLNRAVSMLYPIIFVGKHRRDKHDIPLTWDWIRDQTSLDAYVALSKDEQTPSQWRIPFWSYLKHLPGYQRDVPVNEQSETTLETHGYLQSHVAYVLQGAMRPLELGDGVVLQTRMMTGRDRGIGWCIEQWAKKHPNGLIILDEPDQGSYLLPWLAWATEELQRNGHSIVVAVESIDGFKGAERALLERMQLEQDTLSAVAAPKTSRI